MSYVLIRAALEAQVRAALGAPFANHVVYENDPYTPLDGTPYAVVEIDFATPDDLEYGPNYQEQGLMDLKVMFPPDTGWGDAYGLLDQVKPYFKRGTTLPNGSLVVKMVTHPAAQPGLPVNDRGSPRYAGVLRVPFSCHVTS